MPEDHVLEAFEEEFCEVDGDAEEEVTKRKEFFFGMPSNLSTRLVSNMKNITTTRTLLLF